MYVWHESKWKSMGTQGTNGKEGREKGKRVCDGEYANVQYMYGNLIQDN